MTDRTFFRLPINPDEGFPQAFQLDFGDRAYRMELYVNVLEQEQPAADDEVYELPAPGAFMVMCVSRLGAAAPGEIFRRKLVRDLEYSAAELVFVFRKMRVARRNLNGIGPFGSEVIGGVAARWVS